MGKRDQFIELAQSQVGYAETGDNHTKYAEYFDKTVWQWFNTKKQSSPWCSVWICWLFCQILGADKARTFLGLPSPKNNCAASCSHLWNYLKKLGWQVAKDAGQPGDIIFFNTKKAECAHVGMVEAIDEKYHSIEGNKGDKVGRGVYSKSSSSVYGIMRPNWAEVDTAPTPAPQPQPTPAPTPAPAPSGELYKVKTNGSNLRLRVAPNTNAAVLASMPNGSKVIVNGTSGSWSHTTYNGKTGWAFSKWLVKI